MFAYWIASITTGFLRNSAIILSWVSARGWTGWTRVSELQEESPGGWFLERVTLAAEVARLLVDACSEVLFVDAFALARWADAIRIPPADPLMTLHRLA